MKLTARDKEALRRISLRNESAVLFFQKVTGLKWFDELVRLGFFDPKSAPVPKTTPEGYISTPYWYVLDYFERSSSELNRPESSQYNLKFLDVIISNSQYAMANGISNYRTWWKFSEVITNIDYRVIDKEHLKLIDYWLDDSVDNTLVGESLGMKWLPKLLETGTEHSNELAFELTSMIFRPKLTDVASGLDFHEGPELRIELHSAKEIATKQAAKLGQELGVRVLKRLRYYFKSALDYNENHKLLADLRAAIEDNDQNSDRESTTDLYVDLIRDVLHGAIKIDTKNSRLYLNELLSSEYELLNRIAIHCIGEHFEYCSALYPCILEKEVFWSDPAFKHELWILLNKNYPSFTSLDKSRTLSCISAIFSENSEISEETRAFYKASWLSSIREFGENEENLYKTSVTVADDIEPTHPSYPYYSEAGIVEPESPISIEELKIKTTHELVKYLSNFVPDKSHHFLKDPVRGLYEALEYTIKSDPTKYAKDIDSFIDIKPSFQYHVVESFRKAWAEKPEFPWGDVWDSLLKFIYRLVSSETFWDDSLLGSANEYNEINHEWIVGSIAGLISEGVRNDNHAMDSKYLPFCLKIIKTIMGNQKGNTFDLNMDAVFDAINSPRGKSFEALVNITLRECRIADKLNKGHNEIWEKYEDIYEHELGGNQFPSYEIPTLIARYLPNFIYMSRDWTNSRLDDIFQKTDRKWWRCAMEGHAYTSISTDIYRYLKDGDHFLDALNYDKNEIHHSVKDQTIERICASYLQGLETYETETSLLRMLLDRWDYEEVRALIMDLWHWGRNNDEYEQRIIFMLKEITNRLVLDSKSDRLIASTLCILTGCVKKLDSELLQVVLKIAPLAEEDHNSYHMFEWLIEVSEHQPNEVFKIWLAMLEYSSPVYPKESIKELFRNLLLQGEEGEKQCMEIINRYLLRGNDYPRRLKNEVEASLTND